MAGLAPIAMSQTKEDLLKHLNLPAETYALMAKETDVIYNWLISHKSHLKENGKRKPPYDWSDIQERAKDDAMAMIVQGGGQYTEYFWKIGATEDNNPNWVAKWFLYHKFRYRDGRNRAQKCGEKHHDKHSSSKHKHVSKEKPVEYSYEYGGKITSGTETSMSHYEAAQYGHGVRDSTENNPSQPRTYYDPVRDV